MAQRNDVASALQWLEQQTDVIATAIEQTGARVAAIASGTVNMGGQDLPAVTYTVNAAV